MSPILEPLTQITQESVSLKLASCLGIFGESAMISFSRRGQTSAKRLRIASKVALQKLREFRFME